MGLPEHLYLTRYLDINTCRLPTSYGGKQEKDNLRTRDWTRPRALAKPSPCSPRGLCPRPEPHLPSLSGEQTLHPLSSVLAWGPR